MTEGCSKQVRHFDVVQHDKLFVKLNYVHMWYWWCAVATDRKVIFQQNI